MERQDKENSSERKGQKQQEGKKSITLSGEPLRLEVSSQVDILTAISSRTEADRTAVKQATHILAELAKNEDVVSTIVEGGAVPVLVKHLQAPPSIEGDRGRHYDHEVEKASAFVLGLLAVKREHQQLIVDAGALPLLVDLLKRHKSSSGSGAVSGVMRRAADAITNLAHENSSIKTFVRTEGGIPPLVELLEFSDAQVQKAVAGALRTLAFKNDENKKQIVECNALPALILMLRSEDAAIHYEAVCVLGNLVHSSPNIKKEVLLARALQPVIGLLSSCCSESRREAALLLGQFAATDSDCRVHIVQRGAVPPLIEMLRSPDAQLEESSAFALGRLAQEGHNQAGIVHSGGLVPLLRLLDSKNGSLQHNAAFALYNLADNEDNVADFIKVGGLQMLQVGEFIFQATKDLIAKTLNRLEEKIHGGKPYALRRPQTTATTATDATAWPSSLPKERKRKRPEAEKEREKTPPPDVDIRADAIVFSSEDDDHLVFEEVRPQGVNVISPTPPIDSQSLQSELGSSSHQVEVQVAARESLVGMNPEESDVGKRANAQAINSFTNFTPLAGCAAFEVSELFCSLQSTLSQLEISPKQLDFVKSKLEAAENSAQQAYDRAAQAETRMNEAEEKLVVALRSLQVAHSNLA